MTPFCRPWSLMRVPLNSWILVAQDALLSLRPAQASVSARAPARSVFVLLPSERPALPPYTGLNHGNGFLNTGVLATNPSTPPPSVDVTFAAAGTFRFECTIHPGMQATITVTTGHERRPLWWRAGLLVS